MRDEEAEAAIFANLGRMHHSEKFADHPEVFLRKWQDDCLLYSTAADRTGIYLCYAAPGDEREGMWIPDEIVGLVKWAIREHETMVADKLAASNKSQEERI